MSETTLASLGGVSETLLLPLYNRAMESLRPDALIKDEKAVALVTQGLADGTAGLNFAHIKQIRMNELLNTMRTMLTRAMDGYARDFLNRHPAAVVVHIGCGFDTRFERVDNGAVEWYDLDLPEVIELRRKLIGDEGKRHHLLGCSVLEDAWLETVGTPRQRHFLFLAETVFVYFTQVQVKALALQLCKHFPGAELVFDGWKPFEIRLGNRYLSHTPFAGLMRWGLRHAQELESWGIGFRLLDEWGFFDRPEPRLARFRWMAPLFRWFKPICIFHFRLGEAAR